MRRRDFIGVIYGAALALPCAADAQQPGKVWRIGDVTVSGSERGRISAQALEQRLADLGYVQGRNIVLLHRLSDPQPDKIAEVITGQGPHGRAREQSHKRSILPSIKRRFGNRQPEKT